MELGWLDINGIFYPCDLYDHIFVASQLVRDYNYNFDPGDSEDEVLMRHGWVHITRSVFDYELRIYWDKHLTNAQKNFLKEYFEQDDFPISKICKYEWEEENK